MELVTTKTRNHFLEIYDEYLGTIFETGDLDDFATLIEVGGVCYCVNWSQFFKVGDQICHLGRSGWWMLMR